MSQLTPLQAERFYKLWFPLLRFVNKKKNVVSAKLLAKEPYDPQDIAKVSEKLWADDRLLEQYASENPDGLAEEDLELIRSWRHRVSGTFLVAKQLKKYCVLVSGDPPKEEHPEVYGVVGIRCPLEDLLYDVPAMIKANLIPFEGKIIYDSVFTSFPIQFGRNITRTLNGDYQNAKKRGAIIETLSRSKLALVR